MFTIMNYRAVGSFAQVDGITCNGIAHFDRTSWHNIDNGGSEIGLGGASRFGGGDATDIISDGTNLYICGTFEKVNGQLCNKVVQYDGNSSWCALGWGVDLRPEGLCLYDGKLVITGDLYSADGINMNNIALYDISGSMGRPHQISNNNNISPFRYSLNQNYPNPFNPSSLIKYSIAKATKVTLKIYDVLGREVKTLVDEFKDAGEYDVRFDGTNIASGVYFYRVEAGTFTAVKKMVLIK